MPASRVIPASQPAPARSCAGWNRTTALPRAGARCRAVVMSGWVRRRNRSSAPAGPRRRGCDCGLRGNDADEYGPRRFPRTASRSGGRSCWPVRCSMRSWWPVRCWARSRPSRPRHHRSPGGCASGCDGDDRSCRRPPAHEVPGPHEAPGPHEVPGPHAARSCVRRARPRGHHGRRHVHHGRRRGLHGPRHVHRVRRHVHHGRSRDRRDPRASRPRDRRGCACSWAGCPWPRWGCRARRRGDPTSSTSRPLRQNPAPADGR